MSSRRPAPTLVSSREPVRKELDTARAAGLSVGLVPTMGFLHRAHASLIARSAAECGTTAVTVFVNPLQFGENEDFETYPRDLERDLAVAAEAGADLMFAPRMQDLWPKGPPAARVEVARLSERLEGESRPGHFAGVATVVTTLLSLAGPCRAYFGEKDFQQLLVVRRLVADLALPAQVVACPTVRESDGLACSSRNVRLSPPERVAAAALYRALKTAAGAVAGGERRTGRLRSLMLEVMGHEALVSPEYAEVADAETLELLDVLAGGGAGGQHAPDRQRRRLERRGQLMRRRMLKSKIHRATVTGAEIDYAGSISLDTELMKRADIAEWEQVAVLDVDNGARLETYAIAGDPGQVQLNGAAARLVEPGHRVIVLTYADYDEGELDGHRPKVVHVDTANRAL
jgi:pantoate--beta-alanine ligase